ncbi:MAG: ZIP family metal transporter [Aquihabitans sp.]
MALAIFWGGLGASALLLGAVAAYTLRPGPKVVALVMALGGGLLIGSVSFELIDEAVANADVAKVGFVTLVGALVFTAGDWYLDRRGQRSGGSGGAAGSLAIVFGSVLDGIPESFVLGLTVREGGVSVALLAAVILSNLPEGVSSSTGLRTSGWSLRRVAGMWTVVVVVSALAAGLGYAVLDPGGGNTGALVQAFAAGALLAMVADTMLPDAFGEEGVFTGTFVVIGFSIALVLSAL